MTTAITVKRTGLVKPSKPVRELMTRVERARQAFNEKIARAEAEYWDAVKRAVAVSEQTPDENVPPAENVA
jgi:hypothetical protein